jgi:hypothetical protein
MVVAAGAVTSDVMKTMVKTKQKKGAKKTRTGKKRCERDVIVTAGVFQRIVVCKNSDGRGTPTRASWCSP